MFGLTGIYATLAKLGIAVVAVAALVGGGYYYGHKSEAQVFQDYKDQQAAAAAAQVTSNHDAVAAVNASAVAALQATNQKLQGDLDHANKTHDALVSERSNMLDQLRTRLACPVQHTAAVPGAAASAPVSNGAGSNAALPDGLADLYDFNTRQFYEADQLVAKLNAARQVITQDRATCNGSLPGITPAASAPAASNDLP